MNKLILTLCLFLPVAAAAHPRDQTSTQRVTRNDGDSNNPFVVTTTSYTWTVVGSSNTFVGSKTGPSRFRRRAMTVQTLGTVNYSVCLSSTNAAASACDDSIGGYELGAPWASVSIFDEAVWYVRSRTGGTTVLKGAEHYDSRDEATQR